MAQKCILRFKNMSILGKILTVVLFFGAVGLSLLLSSITPVSAHPGNTSSDGGHYCWTNCESWGEVYGERHFHGGSSGGSNSGGTVVNTGPTEYQQGTTNGANHANSVNRDGIESTATTEGDSDGESDGISGRPFATTSNDSSKYCSDEVQYTSPPTQSYKTAFQSSYTSACIQVYNAKYEARYAAAYTPAKSTFDEMLIAKKKAQDKRNEQYVLYGAVALVATMIGVGIRNSYQKKSGQ